MKKKTVAVLTILFIIFLTVFILVYFYFIRDWKSKVTLDKETIESIALKVNDSDLEFSEFKEISKQIEKKYTNMGHKVYFDSIINVYTTHIFGRSSEKGPHNTIYVKFIDNVNTNGCDLSRTDPPLNIKNFKDMLRYEYGYFRPVFTFFSNRKTTDDYQYYFTPFCWVKGMYHLAMGEDTACNGIMAFKNFTISIYYNSYDIEPCNNLNQFLKDIDEMIS